MPDTVKIPGVGPTKKRTVYIAGGVLALAVGYYYWRARNATVATDTTATDTGTGEAGIDPATGYTYGSAEDQAALAGQYGYQSVGSGAGSTSNPVLPATPTGFTSNAQWSQAALPYLRDEVGHSEILVQAALGNYITGQPATTAQAQLINEAIAAEGYPPVAGPNGYPPSIRTAAAVPTPTQHNPGTQLATPHIYVTAKGRTGDLRIHWNAVPHAGFYLVAGSNFKTQRVAGTQHPNVLIKPPASVHVRAYPEGYSITGQRTKYSPYLASDYSNTITARRK